MNARHDRMIREASAPQRSLVASIAIALVVVVVASEAPPSANAPVQVSSIAPAAGASEGNVADLTY